MIASINIWYDIFISYELSNFLWNVFNYKAVKVDCILRCVPIITVTPIQEGPFRGYSWMYWLKDSLPKTCHTYPEIMKLGIVVPYLKKIQHLIHSSSLHQYFSPEISNFCYIEKYRYRLHFNPWFLILLTLLESVLVRLF